LLKGLLTAVGGNGLGWGERFRDWGAIAAQVSMFKKPWCGHFSPPERRAQLAKHLNVS